MTPLAPSDFPAWRPAGIEWGLHPLRLQRLNGRAPLPETESRFLITQEESLENIRACLARDLPEFEASEEERPGDFVIVGSAPSVLDNLERLAQLAEGGAYIVAVNGAHDLLVRHSLPPSAMLVIDVSPTMVEKHLQHPIPGVSYYIASHCPAATFDALEGFERRVIHVFMDRGEVEVIQQARPSACIIAGHRTAVLRAYNMGYMMGFRRFHMFGVDSSFPEGGDTHAGYDEKHLLQLTRMGYLKANGEAPEFLTSLQMQMQAEDFEELVQIWQPRLWVYGEGLIPTIWAEYYGEDGHFNERAEQQNPV